MQLGKRCHFSSGTVDPVAAVAYRFLFLNTSARPTSNFSCVFIFIFHRAHIFPRGERHSRLLLLLMIRICKGEREYSPASRILCFSRSIRGSVVYEHRSSCEKTRDTTSSSEGIYSPSVDTVLFATLANNSQEFKHVVHVTVPSSIVQI